MWKRASYNHVPHADKASQRKAGRRAGRVAHPDTQIPRSHGALGHPPPCEVLFPESTKSIPHARPQSAGPCDGCETPKTNFGTFPDAPNSSGIAGSIAPSNHAGYHPKKALECTKKAQPQERWEYGRSLKSKSLRGCARREESNHPEQIRSTRESRWTIGLLILRIP